MGKKLTNLVCKFTAERQKTFLSVLSKSCNVSLAAKAAGVSRMAVYKARKRDEKFAKKWEEAIDVGVDSLQGEAWRRAVDGVEKPYIYHGKIAKDEHGNDIMIREYSDQLLLALLRAHLPEKYGDRVRQEITGAGGRPLVPPLPEIRTEAEFNQLILAVNKAVGKLPDAQAKIEHEQQEEDE
jgi:hypothetical protein